MRSTSTIVTASVLMAGASCTCALTFVNSSSQRIQSTSLKMGLFDGMKDAFSAPALEATGVDKERETPIDRWMGWSVKKDEEPVGPGETPVDFIDAMSADNYVTVDLEKPMGVVFEENDEKYGGIFAFKITDGGHAEQDGSIKPGDQLVAVGSTKVSGLPFDDALGAIIKNSSEKTKLIFFRGPAKQFYGPTGASDEWITEFVAAKITV
mmetsp:Transcript_1105/g.2417  ORF Transcript_1105/g.2417 Transcript_1105/m.2417 type:complete len:209 (+) Transcript_1105:131-757(+)